LPLLVSRTRSGDLPARLAEVVHMPLHDHDSGTESLRRARQVWAFVRSY
jgi:hypothetical protein